MIYAESPRDAHFASAKKKLIRQHQRTTREITLPQNPRSTLIQPTPALKSSPILLGSGPVLMDSSIPLIILHFYPSCIHEPEVQLARNCKRRSLGKTTKSGRRDGLKESRQLHHHQTHFDPIQSAWNRSTPKEIDLAAGNPFVRPFFHYSCAFLQFPSSLSVVFFGGSFSWSEFSGFRSQNFTDLT